jgi:hypothetical protein
MAKGPMTLTQRELREREQAERRRREEGRTNWRGTYRLDYERDDDGRISFATLTPAGGGGEEVVHLSATVDGRLLFEFPDDD